MKQKTLFAALAVVMVLTASADVFVWNGGGGDGKFSTLANWETEDGTAVSVAPAAGDSLSFAAFAGGTLVNDIEGLGGADITFTEGAGSYTITGNAFAGVTNVVNVSSSVQTFSNAVAFATTYNVNLATAVNFAGGAKATVPGAVSGAVGKTLTGNITFTSDWSLSSVSYVVPSGSTVTGKKLQGSNSSFTIDNGGYAHFTWVEFGQADSSNYRLQLTINGIMEVDGEARYRNNGVNATRLYGNGKLIAKAFYKTGGKRSFVQLGDFEIGAGSATTTAAFGSIYQDNMIQFQNNVTVRCMSDFEFRSVYKSSNPSENGGISLCEGKTMTINTEDHDGNGHTNVWGCSLCVKPSAGSSYSTKNISIVKTGKGKLIMRSKCGPTGSTGYKKLYNGNTHINGGTLRVEDAGQLGKGTTGSVTYSGSTLNINSGGTFELAKNVNLPNNVKLNGGGQIIAEDGSTIVLNSSSGDNATITMGTGSTLTGNVSLGTNSTVTAGANSKITGSVTVGTNSTVSLGVDAQIASNLTIGDGTTLELGVNADSGVPIGGAIKLASGHATIKLTGDYSSCTNMFTIMKTLGWLDAETNSDNFSLDATGVTFPPKGTYSTSLIVKEGTLMFRAVKNTLRIYIR